MTHPPGAAVPQDAPRKGEIYQHYKGDRYCVVDVALDADERWVVVYEAMYDNPAAPLFVRPVSEWQEDVAWAGATLKRFAKLSD